MLRSSHIAWSNALRCLWASGLSRPGGRNPGGGEAVDEPAQPGPGGVHRFPAEFGLLAVVGLEEKEPVDEGVVAAVE